MQLMNMAVSNLNANLNEKDIIIVIIYFNDSDSPKITVSSYSGLINILIVCSVIKGFS